MEVETAIETPLVFAGDTIKFSIEFHAPQSEIPPPVLLSGYALVQGSFRLGEMMLSEPFAATRKAGVVLSKRGLEYGQPVNSGSLFSGVLDGLKNLVVVKDSRSRPSNASSSSSQSLDDDEEYPIFATSQLLLFTDLQLNSTQKYEVVVDMPANLPPTYRSRSLQVSYQFVVGFERLDPNKKGPPVDTRLFLPFRLMAKPPTISHPHPPKFDLQSPVNAPSPRILHGEDQEAGNMNEFIDKLLEGPANLSRKRSSSIANMPGAQFTKVSYDITRNSVPIAQLLLARPVIFVGDVLAALVKLSRPCLHLSVYLALEESIEEQFAALPHSGLRLTTESEPSTTYTIYSRQFLSTYGLEEVPLYLPTVTSIAPRLDTEQISAKWSLRMELVGLAGSAFADEGQQGLLAKSQVDYETFTCRIPIHILPPHTGGHGAAKSWKM